MLPPGTSKGDVLDIAVTRNPSAERRRDAQIRDTQHRLAKRLNLSILDEASSTAGCQDTDKPRAVSEAEMQLKYPIDDMVSADMVSVDSALEV